MSDFAPLRGIRHLPFFVMLAAEPSGSERARSATAGLLLLRLIDHWILVGPCMVEPDSKSMISARKAIQALRDGDPCRNGLLNIINAMQTQRHVRLEPILPRLAAYGMLLRDHRWARELAGDVDETIAHLTALMPIPPPRTPTGPAVS